MTLWTVARQALLCMGFPRQEYWSAISLLQGIFLTQGLKSGLLLCRQILYHLSYQGSPCNSHRYKCAEVEKNVDHPSKIGTLGWAWNHATSQTAIFLT